jgi:hypothetical protein
MHEDGCEDLEVQTRLQMQKRTLQGIVPSELRGLQSAGYIEEMSVRETEISRDYE